MKLILAAVETTLASAWKRAFQSVGDVEIHQGSILDVQADALVSPANSFGFMDGGIDAIYSETFGWDLQMRLRRAILERHHGELLVGSAEIVATGRPTPPYLIAAPTMRVPMLLDDATVNPFLATRAALLLVKHGTFQEGELAGARIADHVRTVAFPGMGTGVGRVPPEICARQMLKAVATVREGQSRLPSSWAEASEDHQLLYTDKPRRLQ